VYTQKNDESQTRALTLMESGLLLPMTDVLVEVVAAGNMEKTKEMMALAGMDRCVDGQGHNALLVAIRSVEFALLLNTS
jgi:hypothetical protein